MRSADRAIDGSPTTLWRDGEVIEAGRYRFQVISTPGHSLDHICLYEAERGWLFTGDLLVGGRDRALREGYDFWGIIASLKRIAAWPAQRLFPGSARGRDHPAEEIAAKGAHLEGSARGCWPCTSRAAAWIRLSTPCSAVPCSSS